MSDEIPHVTKSDMVAALKEMIGSTQTNPILRSQQGTTSCVYTDPKGKHCIAGQLLKDFGAQLPTVESAHNSLSIGMIYDHPSWDEWKINLDYDAMELLSRAQARADRSIPWGRCAELALKEAGEL